MSAPLHTGPMCTIRTLQVLSSSPHGQTLNVVLPTSSPISVVLGSLFTPAWPHNSPRLRPCSSPWPSTSIPPMLTLPQSCFRMAPRSTSFTNSNTWALESPVIYVMTLNHHSPGKSQPSDGPARWHLPPLKYSTCHQMELLPCYSLQHGPLEMQVLDPHHGPLPKTCSFPPLQLLSYPSINIFDVEAYRIHNE